MSTNAVKSLFTFLNSPKGGHSDYSLKCSPPFNGYWVFAGISQDCIMKLLKSKKPAIEAPGGATGVAGDDLDKNGKKIGTPNNKRKNAPTPVTIPTPTPPVPTTNPTPPSSKRSKKENGQEVTPTSVAPPTGPGSKPGAPGVQTAGGPNAPQSVNDGVEVLAVGGVNALDANKKGQKKAAVKKGKNAKDVTPQATPGPGEASGSETPLSVIGSTTSMPPLPGGLASPRLNAQGRSSERGNDVKGNFANIDVDDMATNARVDMDASELMDFGELDDMREMTELENEDFASFFSPDNKPGKGDHLDDDDLRGDFESLDDLTANFASTPRSGQDVAEIRRVDGSLEDISNMSVEAEQLPQPPQNVVEEEPKLSAVDEEQRRKEDEARDIEVLSMKMNMLPPVSRKPGLLSSFKRNLSGSNSSQGMLKTFGMCYGPSTSPVVAVGSELTRKEAEDKKEESGEAKDLAVGNKEKEANSASDVASDVSSVGNQALIVGKRVGIPLGPKQMKISGNKMLSQISMVESAVKAWRSSRSIAIHTKCTRWALMRRKSKSADGMTKILPLEHLFIQQLAITSFDMPICPPISTPNAPNAPMSTQAVHNAIMMRDLITKEGEAPHLSLEHILKGECGEDPRVMMALDPLCSVTQPTLVASNLSKVVPALDNLVPRLPEERSSDQKLAPLSLQALLWNAKDNLDDVVESLPAPNLLVGSSDGDWIETPPVAVRWWEKLPLEPYSKKKDVVYCVLCASADQQGTASTEASLFFKELSCVYECAHLGKHRFLESKYLTLMTAGSSYNKECKEGIVLVNGLGAPKPATPAAVNPAKQPGSFEEACARALKGFAQYCDEKNGGANAITSSAKVVPVLYILEPDFALGSTWSGSRSDQPNSLPFRARHQWKRALARTLSTAAAMHPRLLDVVVQTVPAQRINMGRRMRWFLRDLAMSVYSKGRIRLRTKPERVSNFAVDIEEEISHFFSGSALTLKKKTRVEPRLYEPLLVVAEPQSIEAPAPPIESSMGDIAEQVLKPEQPPVPDSVMALEDRPAAPGPEPSNTDGVVKMVDDHEPAVQPPVLHCCYSWSDDGLCLGAAITDSTGETLETFSALFGNVSNVNWEPDERVREATCKTMIGKLWASIEEWVKRNYRCSVRLMIGALGAAVPRDIEDWKEILENAGCGRPGSCCCEAIVLQVAVLRSLQLLST
eukprot:768536-Hanusia_phi.AAC.5